MIARRRRTPNMRRTYAEHTPNLCDGDAPMPHPDPRATAIRLGLIGDNIAASRAPLLHREAGAQLGLCITYDRLVPARLGQSFDQIIAACAAGGYRGINVTYPYKEIAARAVAVADPRVRAIGAINTMVFGPGAPQGHNTDHSGFIAAYRAARGAAAPGPTCLIGTGGVGRAAAFALIGLGARDIRLADRDSAKAEAMATELRAAAPGARIRVARDAQTAAKGAAGIVNCTPVGMVGHDGTPLPRRAMAGASWAFDAVYTPVETQFLADAAAEGLAIISGYELFFFQGVHASEIFTARPLDQARLRADLLAGAPD
jgi:shikimate dehydrogenase